MYLDKFWRLLITISTLFALTLSVNSQEVYSQNFDDFGDGDTDLGDGSTINGDAASIQGGRLQLTRDGEALGFSSFSVP
ncbi:MAG: hypothetical protein DBX02_05595, partial [Verrucomicrobia bacterium]